MTKLIVFLIASSFLVAGCATADRTPSRTCSGGSNPHCLVSVITVNGKAAIQAIPDQHVGANDTVILWEIDTDGYTFPDNGIEFPTSFPNNPEKKAAPAGEFDCHRISDTRFRCVDHYRTKGTYGYTVTVRGPGSPPPLDPFIVNG